MPGPLGRQKSREQDDEDPRRSQPAVGEHCSRRGILRHAVNEDPALATTTAAAAVVYTKAYALLVWLEVGM